MFFLNLEDDEDINQNNEEEIFFDNIIDKSLKTEANSLFKKVHEETSNIFLFIQQEINKFQELFEQNIKTVEETMNYLEKIAIPNNCKCSELIDSVPGWKCLDCSKSDSIYCSNCFVKSKNLHKGHKIHYLPKAAKICSRCDCGDPNNLNIFCSDHKGPFNEMKQIDEFIEKSFYQN